MTERLSDTTEDYLKAIYEIACMQGRATTAQLALRLGVTPASVTGMLKRLAHSKPPLVEYYRHRGVCLTEAGQRAALEIIRHHRLLEQYLYECLGYTWDQVHDEADRLEHVISEDFEERIAQVLGNPSYDPHGEPIPGRDLSMPPPLSTRLSEIRPGQRVIVAQVLDTDPEFLRYLSRIGLTPRVMVTVLAYSSFDGNLTLQIVGQEQALVLGPAVTGRVMVTNS